MVLISRTGARLGTGGIVAIAVAAYALLAWRLDFLCDDAYITFRYAENWASGHGLVYHPGIDEPVEGYSSSSGRSFSGWVRDSTSAWRPSRGCCPSRPVQGSWGSARCCSRAASPGARSRRSAVRSSSRLRVAGLRMGDRSRAVALGWRSMPAGCAGPVALRAAPCAPRRDPLALARGRPGRDRRAVCSL